MTYIFIRCNFQNAIFSLLDCFGVFFGGGGGLPCFMKEKYYDNPLLKLKVVLFCAVIFAMQKSV